ncbi:MAG: family 43 glycosylhydrolase [Mediterraneibacter faecis]
MKQQVFNPYLPSWEYIPDGEPHVFGDRVYVYGSHDSFGARNKLGIRCLYAPDVTQGPDGRYYLYYAFDFMGEMGVAVCDTPAGRYEFYGHVHFKDGHVWGKSGEPFPFDPGILVDDDKRVYLCWGGGGVDGTGMITICRTSISYKRKKGCFSGSCFF